MISADEADEGALVASGRTILRLANPGPEFGVERVKVPTAVVPTKVIEGLVGKIAGRLLSRRRLGGCWPSWRRLGGPGGDGLRAVRLGCCGHVSADEADQGFAGRGRVLKREAITRQFVLPDDGGDLELEAAVLPLSPGLLEQGRK